MLDQIGWVENTEELRRSGERNEAVWQEFWLKILEAGWVNRIADLDTEASFSTRRPGSRWLCHSRCTGRAVSSALLI